MSPLLFRVARGPLGRLFVSFFVVHLSFVLPIKRLATTSTLIAFYHPRPSYPVHILLVSRRARRSLADLKPEDGDFLQDLFLTVRQLVRQLDLEPQGYRLIANGGAYQDVPHLHFHLIAGESR